MKFILNYILISIMDFSFGVKREHPSSRVLFSSKSDFDRTAVDVSSGLCSMKLIFGFIKILKINTNFRQSRKGQMGRRTRSVNGHQRNHSQIGELAIPERIGRFRPPSRSALGGVALSCALHLVVGVLVLTRGPELEPEVEIAAPVAHIAEAPPIPVVFIVESPPRASNEAPADAEPPLEAIALPEPEEPEPVAEREPPVERRSRSRRQDPEPEPAIEPPPSLAEPVVTSSEGRIPFVPRSPTVRDTSPGETARVAIRRPAPASAGQSIDQRGLLRGYAQQVSSEIQRGLRHPTRSRRPMEGTVIVEIVLDEAGRILRASVVESSGFETLDDIALRRVLDMERLSAPPVELAWDGRSLRVPIRFARRAA